MIDLATLKLSPRQMTRNVMLAGLPGTGKTVLIWFLLESLVEMVIQHDARIIMTDPKKETAPIITGLFPDWVRIMLTHPLDARSVSLDFSRTFTTLGDSERLGNMMIHEDRGSSEAYWRNISRLLFSHLANYFQVTRPGNWTLLDLVSNACDGAKLESRLSRFSASKGLVAATFKDKEHRAKVISSLASYMGQYRVLADNWSRCNESVSVDDVLQSRCVFLLGHDEKLHAQFGKLNGLIVNELSSAILSNRDKSKWHFIILDEFALLKGFADIRELLLKARDANVSVVISIQDPSSVVASLGKERFTEIASMMQFKVFMRMGAEGAEWASRQTGHQEVLENGSTKTRPVISPEEFMALPLAHGEHVEGFVISPYGSPAKFKLPFRKRLSGILSKASGVGFMPRPKNHGSP